jgi:hypothetical protein
MDFRQRLERFYEKYAPDKLYRLDEHLLKYAGREEDFLEALAQKYGPEPPAPLPTPATTATQAEAHLTQQTSSET